MRVGPVAGAVIAGLCLAGCGGDPAAAPVQEPPAVVTLPKPLSPPPAGAPTSATPPAPAESATATAEHSTENTGTPDDEPTSAAEETSTEPAGDVACGTFTNKAGTGFQLFAGRNDAGAVLSCGEADRVMTKYLSLPREEYQGSGRFANFEDYGCASTPTDRTKAQCATSDGRSSYITD